MARTTLGAILAMVALAIPIVGQDIDEDFDSIAVGQLPPGWVKSNRSRAGALQAGSNEGGGLPWNRACTASTRKPNEDRLC